MKLLTPRIFQLLGLALGSALLLAPTLVWATSSYPPPVNVRVTTIAQLNNEEQTCISPVDTNIIISCWRDFRLGYRQIGIGRSTDGGQTWTDSLIHPAMQYINLITAFAGPVTNNWQSDPTLTVDRFGNFYMSVLDFAASADNDSSTITFYKTVDAGLTWTGPVPLSPVFAPAFEDKQFITVDNSSGATDGNVYMSWTRFPNPDRIVFIRSTDGAASFEDTVVVGPIQTSTGCGGSNIDAGQFSIPVVGANGDVHVFWQGFKIDSGGCFGSTFIKHVVSGDGGLTFTYEDNVQQVSGYTSAPGGINTYSQPVVDVDRTSGPFAGRMYLCYTNRGPEDDGRTDVDLNISDDNALTWSSRVQLNDDINSGLNDSFHPWLFVNEDGVVIVIYYDNRLDAPFYEDFDLFATYSFDGGATFTSNHRITDVSSDPGSLFSPGADGRRDKPIEYGETFDPRDMPLQTPQAGLLGEYIGLSANHDKVTSTWTDSRDFNSEVYSASWYLPLLEPKLIAPDDGGFAAASPDFLWATSWKNDADQYRLEVATDGAFSSIIETRVIDTNLNDLGVILGDGEYFWRVKAFNLSNSDSSEYSAVHSFQVDGTPPSTPSLLSPTDALLTLNPKPAFDWTDAVDALSAVSYEIDFSTDAGFPAGPLTTTFSGLAFSDYTPTDSLDEDVATFWRVRALDVVGNTSGSVTFSVTFHPACCLTSGDYNHDGSFNIADVTAGIARIFSSGSAPACQDEADADGDNAFNIADVTYGIARIFSAGPAPICGSTGFVGN